MPTLVQDAINQQRNLYPGGRYAGPPVPLDYGGTVSAAPERVGPLDPGYAYQYDLPRWLQNTIYGAQLPLRGAAYAQALPAEALHLVAKPQTNMFFTGSPFDPGQVPSWWPKNFLQPRTDPVTNVMRKIGHGVDFVGETAMMPYVAPEAILAGRGMPAPTISRENPIPELREATPSDIVAGRLKFENQIRAAREHNANYRALDEAASRKDWQSFGEILKKDPVLWKMVRDKQRNAVLDYADREYLMNLARRREYLARVGKKEDIEAFNKEIEGVMQQQERSPVVGGIRYNPEKTGETKFRGFVKPGTPKPSGEPPIGMPPGFPGY